MVQEIRSLTFFSGSHVGGRGGGGGGGLYAVLYGNIIVVICGNLTALECILDHIT